MTFDDLPVGSLVTIGNYCDCLFKVYEKVDDSYPTHVILKMYKHCSKSCCDFTNSQEIWGFYNEPIIKHGRKEIRIIWVI